MNHSTITLFRNTKFYPNQNYKIDNIEEFLNSFLSADKKVFQKQQYWKINGITKEFKLEIPQSDIKNIHEYNYAKVEMIVDTEEIEYKEWTLYYFITNFEWISRNTIKLILRLDTLNTFLDTLQFHSKTFIEREHIDRWNYESYIKDDTNQRITLLRDIPELSEDLNPQKYNYSVNNNYDFIISYSFNCSISIYESNMSGTWWCLYLGDPDGDVFTDKVNFTIYLCSSSLYLRIPTESESHPIKSGDNVPLVASENLKLILIPYAPTNDTRNPSEWTSSNPYTNSNSLTPVYFKYSQGEGSYWELYGLRRFSLKSTPSTQFRNHFTKISEYFSTPSITYPLKSFRELMRNIFCVINKDYSEIANDIVDNGYFKTNNYSNESGMYNGEFFELNFSLCDNEYNIHLQDFKYNGKYTLSQLFDDSIDNKFIKILFSTPSNIDNYSLFKFGSNFNNEDDGAFDYEISKPYGDLMICPLNTQIPLITSDYFNYMRNGYNYDIKLRDLGRDERKINIGLKGATTGLTLGLGIATGGTAGTLLGGKAIKGGMGIISGLVSDYYSTMKEDIEMEKTLAQLKSSKLNVEQINGGIDKYLSSNSPFKLSLTLRLPKKSWWKYLEDYFYYFGSKAQYYGIPTHNNRCLFDYLKCKAEFVNKNSIPTQEALTDIITRLNIGVVFVHKFMNKWTFDSDYKENIERELYNIISEEN